VGRPSHTHCRKDHRVSLRVIERVRRRGDIVTCKCPKLSKTRFGRISYERQGNTVPSEVVMTADMKYMVSPRGRHSKGDVQKTTHKGTNKSSQGPILFF